MISASELRIMQDELDNVKHLYLLAILSMIEEGVDSDVVLCNLHWWAGIGMNVPNIVTKAFGDQYGVRIDCRGEVKVVE